MKVFLFIGYFVFFYKFFYISACISPSFKNLTVQNDFNLTKFLGIWFEIKWLPGEPHNESEIWRNYYQSFNINNSSKEKLLVYGKARLLYNDTCFSFGPWSIITNNSAKMILEKKNIQNDILLNWPYYILKTDYNNYALVYGCMTENYTYDNSCSDPILWLFGRKTTLSNNYSIMLDDYIQNDLCVNLTELEITPHDGIQCYSSISTSNIRFSYLIFLFFLFICI